MNYLWDMTDKKKTIRRIDYIGRNQYYDVYVGIIPNKISFTYFTFNIWLN